MSIEPVFPETLGEWLAWLSALLTVLVGLWMFLAPRNFMRRFGLVAAPGRKDGVSEIRTSFGGFHIGLGLAVLAFHPQPLMYFALAAALLFAALGRIVAIIFDRDFSVNNLGGLVAETAFGILPLLYVLGYVQ